MSTEDFEWPARFACKSTVDIALLHDKPALAIAFDQIEQDWYRLADEQGFTVVAGRDVVRDAAVNPLSTRAMLRVSGWVVPKGWTP